MRPLLGQIDNDERNVLAERCQNGFNGMRIDRIVAFDAARACQQAQPFPQIDEKTVEKNAVHAVRLAQGVENSICDINVEVEARGAEGKIKVGDDRIRIVPPGERIGEVMRQGAGAGATPRTDECDDFPERRRLWVDEERCDRLDQPDGPDRRDHVFADTLMDQFAIEDDVVDPSDNDHLGVRLADFGKLGEFRQNVALRPKALNDQHRRRWHLPVHLNGRRNTAGMDLGVGAGHPAIGGGSPHGVHGLGINAECGDVDMGHQHRGRDFALTRGSIMSVHAVHGVACVEVVVSASGKSCTFCDHSPEL